FGPGGARRTQHQGRPEQQDQRADRWVHGVRLRRSLSVGNDFSDPAVRESILAALGLPCKRKEAETSSRSNALPWTRKCCDPKAELIRVPNGMKLSKFHGRRARSAKQGRAGSPLLGAAGSRRLPELHAIHPRPVSLLAVADG